MEPTDKSEGVENFLEGFFGFDRRESITQLKCVPEPIGCGKPLIETDTVRRFIEQGQKVHPQEGPFFKDEPSRKDFQITGMCQDCQDRVEAYMLQIEAESQPYPQDVPEGEAPF